LSEDKYGNYVIQHILLFGDYKYKYKIVDIVKSNLQSLCTQKYSSNVVQLTLKQVSEDHKNQLISSILNNKNRELLIDLMKNMYGNYVIQTALEMANDNQRSKLIKFASENKEMLKRVRYGKHILNKIEEYKHNMNNSE